MKIRFVLAALATFAVAAPSLASAATVVIRHPHHHHHHDRVVIIKHGHRY